MYIDSIVRIKVIRASFMDKSFRNNTFKQDWQNIYIYISIDQTCPVMHANALLMQYHFFY